MPDTPDDKKSARPQSAPAPDVQTGSQRQGNTQHDPRSIPASDPVEEADRDSFPASDPPSWSPSRAGTPEQ